MGLTVSRALLQGLPAGRVRPHRARSRSAQQHAGLGGGADVSGLHLGGCVLAQHLPQAAHALLQVLWRCIGVGDAHVGGAEGGVGGAAVHGAARHQHHLGRLERAPDLAGVCGGGGKGRAVVVLVPGNGGERLLAKGRQAGGHVVQTFTGSRQGSIWPCLTFHRQQAQPEEHASRGYSPFRQARQVLQGQAGTQAASGQRHAGEKQSRLSQKPEKLPVKHLPTTSPLAASFVQQRCATHLLAGRRDDLCPGGILALHHAQVCVQPIISPRLERLCHDHLGQRAGAHRVRLQGRQGEESRGRGREVGREQACC